MSKKGSIKKEWNGAVESWLDFVRQGKDYWRDELNNPAAFRLIGSVKGQLVLDLACGEGYNARILARKGAKVTAVDFSEKMTEAAKLEEAKEKLGISYYVMDATNLEELPSDFFDLVTCFMSMQDIEHYEKAVSEVARVLKNQGRFVFSIPHPCFETLIEKGKNEKAEAVYFGAARYPLQWKMERLIKPFRTTSFHRTLTEYFDALFRSKLVVSRLVEPTPTRKGLKNHPPLRRGLIRPQSIIVESIKISRHQML